MAVRSCRVMLISQCNFITEQAGADISWPPAFLANRTMQDPPQWLSAMPFLSSILQGHRHSVSDTGLRLPQGQHDSVAKMLSSSSLQVMVAGSSVSCAKRNPTCPKRKSKIPFFLKITTPLSLNLRNLKRLCCVYTFVNFDNSILYVLPSVMVRVLMNM